MDYRREVAVALAEAAEMVAAAVREEAPGSQVAGVDGDVAVVTVPDHGLRERMAGRPGVAPQPALLTALAEVAPLAARHVADAVAAALRDTLRRGGIR